MAAPRRSLARRPVSLRSIAPLLLALAALPLGAVEARAQTGPPAAEAPLDPLALEARLRAVAAKLLPSTLLIRATDASGERTWYGSGVVIDPAGLALTCAHVVEGAHEIEATLADGRSFTVLVRGANGAQDYALVQLDAAAGLVACPLGDSERVGLGDWVAAAGHPGGPYPDLQPAFAAGRVTGLHRRIPIQAFERYYDDAIRTDIPIFPGNSGGPLVDLDGRLIGINGAILLLNENSYAVPIGEIQAHMDRLERGDSIAGRKARGLPIPLGEFGERDLVRFAARFVRRAFGKEGLGAPFAGPEGEHTDATRMLERFGEALGDERFLGDLAKGIAGENADDAQLRAIRRVVEAWGKPDAGLEDLVGPLGDLFGGGPGEEGGGGSQPDRGGSEPDAEAVDPVEELLKGLLGGGQNEGGDLLRRLFDELSGGVPEAEPEDIERAVERLSSRELKELIESTDPATLERMARDLGEDRLRAMLARLRPEDIEALLAGPRGPDLRRMMAQLYGAPPPPPGRSAPPAAPPRATAPAPRPTPLPVPAPAPAPAAPGAEAQRPYLGIRVDPDAESARRIQGVVVAEVVPGDPADRAGIRKGDVIVALGGRSVDGQAALGAALGALAPGETVDATVLRTGADGIPLGERVEMRLTVGGR